MNEHLDPTVLANWLAGDSTPEELDAVNAWLAVDPARRADLDEAREVWTRAREVLAVEAIPGDDAAAAKARWIAIRQAIGGNGDMPRRTRPAPAIEFPLSSRPGRLRRWGVAVAASVAMLAFGGRAAWQGITHKSPQLESAIAAVGRPDSITFSDGSAVVLAPGSRVTFANGKTPGSIRAVTLDGQAYFRVAHDAQRPFVVTAGAVVTRVLGTEFNVKAYADDDVSAVTVRSGRVGVRRSHVTATDSPEIVVTPGYETRVGSRGDIRVEVANVDRALAWTAGRLEFVSTDLASVLRDVNRWYGIQLRLADTSLAHHRLTIKFDGETKDQVLARLTRLLGPNAFVLSSGQGSSR